MHPGKQQQQNDGGPSELKEVTGQENDILKCQKKNTVKVEF